MAWDSYTGRHRINVTPAGARCLTVNQRRTHANVPIGKVCQKANGRWDYSYVGGSHYARHGDLPSARAAIKATVRSWRTWMGVTTLSGARRKRRRRR